MGCLHSKTTHLHSPDDPSSLPDSNKPDPTGLSISLCLVFFFVTLKLMIEIKLPLFFNNTIECLIFFLIDAIGNSFCKFLARIIFLEQNIVWLKKEEKLFTPGRSPLSSNYKFETHTYCEMEYSK